MCSLLSFSLSSFFRKLFLGKFQEGLRLNAVNKKERENKDFTIVPCWGENISVREQRYH